MGKLYYVDKKQLKISSKEHFRRLKKNPIYAKILEDEEAEMERIAKMHREEKKDAP